MSPPPVGHTPTIPCPAPWRVPPTLCRHPPGQGASPKPGPHPKYCPPPQTCSPSTPPLASCSTGHPPHTLPLPTSDSAPSSPQPLFATQAEWGHWGAAPRTPPTPPPARPCTPFPPPAHPKGPGPAARQRHGEGTGPGPHRSPQIPVATGAAAIGGSGAGTPPALGPGQSGRHLLNIKHKGGSSREKKTKWGGTRHRDAPQRRPRVLAVGMGAGGAASPTLCSLTHVGFGWCRMGAGPLRHFPGSARSLCDSVTTCCGGGRGRKWGSAPWWGSDPPPPPPPGRALQPPILTCPSRVSMVLMSTILRTGLSAGCASSTGAQRPHQPPLSPSNPPPGCGTTPGQSHRDPPAHPCGVCAPKRGRKDPPRQDRGPSPELLVLKEVAGYRGTVILVEGGGRRG